MRKPEAELQSALGDLAAAGLLFRQGVPPHTNYLFKHALVQDAAYGMLLREPRRALHARIADILESQFAEITENHPELLARHCTEAGLIEKAVQLWSKAGQRSLARSALVEATEQLSCAVDQIAKSTSHAQYQAAADCPSSHVNRTAPPHQRIRRTGNESPAVERALLLIKQAEAAGEAPR